MASIKLAKHLNDRREARCFETVVDALLRFPLKNWSEWFKHGMNDNRVHGMTKYEWERGRGWFQL